MMNFKISQVTMSAENVDAMVKFYEDVFELKLHPFEAYGETLYSTKLPGDITFLICPNTIAGVKAEQNRQQFDFIVDNIDNVVKAATGSGGTLMNDIVKDLNGKSVTVIDPDGNTMNFIEKINNVN